MGVRAGVNQQVLVKTERVKEYVRMNVRKNLGWIMGAMKIKLLIMNIKLLIKNAT